MSDTQAMGQPYSKTELHIFNLQRQEELEGDPRRLAFFNNPPLLRPQEEEGGYLARDHLPAFTYVVVSVPFERWQEVSCGQARDGDAISAGILVEASHREFFAAASEAFGYLVAYAWPPFTYYIENDGDEWTDQHSWIVISYVPTFLLLRGPRKEVQLGVQIVRESTKEALTIFKSKLHHHTTSLMSEPPCVNGQFLEPRHVFSFTERRFHFKLVKPEITWASAEETTRGNSSSDEQPVCIENLHPGNAVSPRTLIASPIDPAPLHASCLYRSQNRHGWQHPHHHSHAHGRYHQSCQHSPNSTLSCSFCRSSSTTSCSGPPDIAWNLDRLELDKLPRVNNNPSELRAAFLFLWSLFDVKEAGDPFTRMITWQKPHETIVPMAANRFCLAILLLWLREAERRLSDIPAPKDNSTKDETAEEQRERVWQSRKPKFCIEIATECCDGKERGDMVVVVNEVRKNYGSGGLVIDAFLIPTTRFYDPEREHFLSRIALAGQGPFVDEKYMRMTLPPEQFPAYKHFWPPTVERCRHDWKHQSDSACSHNVSGSPASLDPQVSAICDCGRGEHGDATFPAYLEEFAHLATRAAISPLFVSPMWGYGTADMKPYPSAGKHPAPYGSPKAFFASPESCAPARPWSGGGGDGTTYNERVTQHPGLVPTTVRPPITSQSQYRMQPQPQPTSNFQPGPALPSTLPGAQPPTAAPSRFSAPARPLEETMTLGEKFDAIQKRIKEASADEEAAKATGDRQDGQSSLPIGPLKKFVCSRCEKDLHTGKNGKEGGVVCHLCHITRYCSRECKKKAAKSHKKQCEEYRIVGS